MQLITEALSSENPEEALQALTEAMPEQAEKIQTLAEIFSSMEHNQEWYPEKTPFKDGSNVNEYQAEDVWIVCTEHFVRSNEQKNTACIMQQRVDNMRIMAFVIATLDCDSVRTMKEKNKIEFYSIEEANEKNYNPCSRCNPH